MIKVPPTQRVTSDELVRILHDARRRTDELTADLAGERLLGPKLAIVNPVLWEVGHVGFFHDYFALCKLYGLDRYQLAEAEALYDSSAIPHDDRWELPLPPMDRTREYLDRVHAAMISRLPDAGQASETQSYVYQLTTFHEDMHSEAFFWTRQTLQDPPPSLLEPADLPAAEPPGPLPGDVHVPAGEHRLGSGDDVFFRFDNEKPSFTVPVEPFSIARAPVTNAEFAAFVEDGGFENPRYWSDEGWALIQRTERTAPVYWRRGANGGWEMRWFDRWIALPPHQPVCFVSFYEAEAYCAWAGRRLPSEVEWEVAASRAPTPDGTALAPGKRIYPWGDAPPSAERANLDGYRLGCVDVAALPKGDSPFGCRQMFGNVWEWTSSLFKPYPGFQADLYRDYSQPWFKEDRRVLRGGAWPTRGRMLTTPHRNFFLPERTDLFSGFRTCAAGHPPR